MNNILEFHMIPRGFSTMVVNDLYEKREGVVGGQNAG
jgi:hypothetical protein